jgi:large conductance mechanosensitive channel
VITPAIALLFGEPDFDSLLTFGERDAETGQPAGSLGALLTASLNFLLVAFALFLLVRAYNRMRRRRPEEPEPETDPEDVVLLREIRDALRERS